MRVNKIKLIQNDKILAVRDLSESCTSANGFFVRSKEQVVSVWEDLQLANSPIQLVPVKAATSGVTKVTISSLEGYNREPHTLCLVGTSDECQIELLQNEHLFIDGLESVLLTKGRCLDLNFSPSHAKYVLSKTTMLNGY